MRNVFVRGRVARCTEMRVTASRALDNGVQKRAKLSSGSDLRRSNLSGSKSDAIFAETVLMNPLDCNKI